MPTATEKLFYTLGENGFQEKLREIKSQSSTLVLLSGEKGELFYAYSPTIKEKSLSFEKAVWELDEAYQSFTSFAKKQIIQYLLIEEIQSTNEIEGVHSTRHDIFSLLHKEKTTASSKKIRSMVNSYVLLLNNEIAEPTSLKDIRNIYDDLLKGAIDKDDQPDGRYFRKGPVSIVGSTEILHNGILGEANVEKAMLTFLGVYHSDQLSFIERMLISHYLFEVIHPYYDGNGRLGRFLLSIAFQNERNSIFAYLLSVAINKSKTKYYQAFKDMESFHNFGDLEAFVEPLINIFTKEAASFKTFLLDKKKEAEALVGQFADSSFSKSEKKVASFIAEGSLWSQFGVTNQEIMEETKVSRRTLLYAVKKMKALSMCHDAKFGKTVYHKFEGSNAE